MTGRDDKRVGRSLVKPYSLPWRRKMRARSRCAHLQPMMDFAGLGNRIVEGQVAAI